MPTQLADIKYDKKWNTKVYKARFIFEFNRRLFHAN